MRGFARQLPASVVLCVVMVLGCLRDGRAEAGAIWQQRVWGTAEGLPQNSVHAIAQTPDGFLWLATEAGLARFDGAQFRVYSRDELGRSVSDDLCCLSVDGEGVLWVGSSFGVAALRNSHVLSLPDRAPFAGAAVQQLLVENGRTVAVMHSGIFALSASGKADPLFEVRFAAAGPLTLHQRNGGTWIGSESGLKYVAPGRADAEDVAGFARQSVLALMEDSEGDVWVGTDTTGLHRLHREIFHALPGSQGIPATAVAWSSRGVLEGSRTGELRRISRDGRVEVLARFGAGVTCLAAGSNAIWAGTTNGLYSLDSSGQVRRFTSAEGLPDDYIRSVAIDKTGHEWAGTAHGLAHVGGSGVETLAGKAPARGDLIGAVVAAHSSGTTDEVWAATESGLILFGRAGAVREVNFGGGAIAGMAYDRGGALWVATQDGGVWQSDGVNARKALQLPLAGARQAVQALFVDDRNTLWIALRDGMLSTSVARMRACTPAECNAMTPLVASWGVADGMPSAETVPSGFGSPAEDGDGDILFATRAGVAVANAAEAARSRRVPVLMERAALENRALDAQDLEQIPYGRTRLTFEYVGVSLGHPSRVRYRVRLRGFDADWIETGMRRTVTYTALPPGPYRLEVEGTLEGQPWPETSTALDFRISPPFYRRWWFLLLATAVLVGTYLLFYRLRLAVERRRFALVMDERNRLAREVHDTIAQDMVSTGIQLDVVLFALDHQPRERVSELLKSLRRTVAQALAEARESIGELRDPNLRFDLVSRLQRMVERKSTTSVPVTLEMSGAQRSLPSTVEMELLRIATEAVGNALRHAHAPAVAVQLRYSREGLAMAIKDDGCGFSPAEAEAMAGHYGLHGMRERAETIGALLTVDSSPGRGSTVTVFLSYAR